MKLKKEKIKSLENQAQEIRDEIIESISKSGGHLSSNLGMVELTIMIHEVFDLPNDTLILDVSHQCYAHKLLSGRKLDDLGHLDKISGFMNPNESAYDAYSLGHSSTSISLAVGEAIKCQKQGIQKNIIAVIGDASLNNGLALDALNFLNEHKDLKVIVIVNDNNMSISPTAGGITKSLNSVRASRKKALIYRITPRFMHPVWNWFKRVIKGIFYKKNFFDAYDIKHFVGIDGHDFKELNKYLTFAKNYNESVILHINTIKGKGYKYAENDEIGIWHSVGPFDIEAGEFLTKVETVGEAISNELIKINDEFHNIKVITAAMSLGNGINSFKEKYPDDFIDVGIGEENACVMAAGMASQDIIPIVFIYSTFLQRAYDEILSEIARCHKKVIFMIDRAGIVSYDGDHHQGIFDVSFLSPLPNMTILAPASIEEATALLRYALTIDGPVAIRYPKQLPHQENYEFTPRWQEIYPKNNTNIITYNYGVFECKESFKNMNVGLINASIIKPIDVDLIKSLENKKVIIYEEVNDQGGLFDLINHYIKLNGINIDLEQIAIVNTYLESGSSEELKKKYHLNIDELKRKIK